MVKVQWTEKRDVAINTVEELDRLLDDLHDTHQQSPELVTIELLSSGDSLSIGLGRAESVLNFVSGSGAPPYWSSVGVHSEEEGVEFNFMGQLSEIPIRNLISMHVARQAVRDFVKTGSLSSAVKWEEC